MIELKGQFVLYLLYDVYDNALLTANASCHLQTTLPTGIPFQLIVLNSLNLTTLCDKIFSNCVSR